MIHTTYVVKFNTMGNMNNQDFGCALYVEWITISDGSLHSHQDCTNLYNINCQTIIWRCDELNNNDSRQVIECAMRLPLTMISKLKITTTMKMIKRFKS